MRRVFSLILLLFCLALPGWAQDAVLPDYDEWTRTAERAERVIDADRASDPAFETLRTQLVDWRESLNAASGINADRVASLQEQIAALGPAPQEGVLETDEIAAQRLDLEQRLSEASAPGLRASAELRRALGLIDEIDTLLARRQAGALLTLQPSPVNPANWPGALSAMAEYAEELVAENLQLLQSPVHRAELRESAPVVVFFLITGFLLIFRGWRWAGQLMRRSLAIEAESAVARLSVFFLSMAQHALPALGVISLVHAVEVSSYVGLRSSVIFDQLPLFVAYCASGLWVGRQVFPARTSAEHPLELTGIQRRQGRRAAGWLGALMGTSTLFNTVFEIEGFADVERLALAFPVVLLTGLLLVRVARLLLSHVKTVADRGEIFSVRTRLFSMVGRVVFVLGILGPILAAVGYFTAGASFLFPTVLSLGLMAVLGVLQRLVTNIYAALRGNQGGIDEALTPTLIGFALSILSLPLFALIWGLREAQLQDYWRGLIDGLEIGGVEINPRNFLLFALVFAAGYTATRLVQSALRLSVLPKTKLDAGGRNAVATGTGYLGIILSALIAITVAGIDLSSIAIVAGALSVGIGFGLQAIVSNFVSGIILLVERPIKEGDWVEIGSTAGYVREISVRATRIETFDRSDVIVPNADLISGVVTNMTHQNSTGRVLVPVGVAYGTDTRKVERILKEIAESNQMVLLNPPPNVLLLNFGADSLDFELRVFLRDVNWMLNVKSEINHEIARRFAEEGIEIPFAQRDIWLRNPEALRGDTQEET